MSLFDIPRPSSKKERGRLAQQFDLELSKLKRIIALLQARIQNKRAMYSGIHGKHQYYVERYQQTKIQKKRVTGIG